MPEFQAACHRRDMDEQAEWQRSAMICAILANQARPKGHRAFTMDDFMPKHRANPASEGMATKNAAILTALTARMRQQAI